MIYIYALRDPVTKKIRYVGKTKNPETRLARHINKSLTSDHHSARWIKSLVSIGLKPTLEIIRTVPDGEIWQQCEIEMIEQYRNAGHPLTNMTAGGDGVHDPHPDIIEKLRLAGTGKKHTEEARAKVAAYRTGKKHSLETLAKMRARRCDRQYAPRKALTQEHRANISASLMGIVRSPETRAKMSAAKSGRKVSAEGRANMAASKLKYFARKRGDQQVQ